MIDTSDIIARMQRTEREKVKARIKALTEKTTDNGCSESEALAAAGMVGKLLEQYNLTMDEIDIRDEKCVTVSTYGRVWRGDVMFHCVMSIGTFCDAKAWYTPGRKGGKNCYWFFGLESDTQMAIYLFSIVQSAVETELAAFKTSDTYKSAWSKRAATASFQKGMAYRIAARLVAMKQERENELRKTEAERQKRASEQALKAALRERIRAAASADKVIDDTAFESAFEDLLSGAGSVLDGVYIKVRQQGVDHYEPVARATGSALVVLKGVIVEEEFKKRGPKLRKTVRRTIIGDGTAYNRGQEAGAKINLNRPVGSDKKAMMIS